MVPCGLGILRVSRWTTQYFALPNDVAPTFNARNREILSLRAIIARDYEATPSNLEIDAGESALTLAPVPLQLQGSLEALRLITFHQRSEMPNRFTPHDETLRPNIRIGLPGISKVQFAGSSIKVGSIFGRKEILVSQVEKAEFRSSSQGSHHGTFCVALFHVRRIAQTDSTFLRSVSATGSESHQTPATRRERRLC